MYRVSLFLFAGMVLAGSGLQVYAQASHLELDRKGETIVLEPYAPNIVRVTLSLQHDPALAKPGYGFVASSDAAGWSAARSERADVYRSSQLVVDDGTPPSLREARAANAGGHQQIL